MPAAVYFPSYRRKQTETYEERMNIWRFNNNLQQFCWKNIGKISRVAVNLQESIILNQSWWTHAKKSFNWRAMDHFSTIASFTLQAFGLSSDRIFVQIRFYWLNNINLMIKHWFCDTMAATSIQRCVAGAQSEPGEVGSWCELLQQYRFHPKF